MNKNGKFSNLKLGAELEEGGRNTDLDAVASFGVPLAAVVSPSLPGASELPVR